MDDTTTASERFMAPATDDGTPVTDGMPRWERGVKRAFDFFFSGLLMVVFCPLYFLCWLAVRLEDGAPSIYRQERIGKDGKSFMIRKFRSMRTDAEKDGPQLFDTENDPRLTRTGNFLRAHHLDELPQLWNVFRGEMSFIGPRPERKYYIDRIMEVDGRYKYLYQIRPGVTSFATLYNGYTDTLDKMVLRLRYDLYYLEHGSLRQELKILWRTFTGIVGGRKF